MAERGTRRRIKVQAESIAAAAAEREKKVREAFLGRSEACIGPSLMQN